MPDNNSNNSHNRNNDDNNRDRNRQQQNLIQIAAEIVRLEIGRPTAGGAGSFAVIHGWDSIRFPLQKRISFADLRRASSV